jgi:hypothetical protein
MRWRRPLGRVRRSGLVQKTRSGLCVGQPGGGRRQLRPITWPGLVLGTPAGARGLAARNQRRTSGQSHEEGREGEGRGRSAKEMAAHQRYPAGGIVRSGACPWTTGEVQQLANEAVRVAGLAVVGVPFSAIRRARCPLRLAPSGRCSGPLSSGGPGTSRSRSTGGRGPSRRTPS